MHLHMSYSCLTDSVHHRKLQRSVGPYVSYLTQSVHVECMRRKCLEVNSRIVQVFKITEQEESCWQPFPLLMQSWITIPPCCVLSEVYCGKREVRGSAGEAMTKV